MMKKITTVLLAMLLILALMGCSKNTPAGEDTIPTTSDTEAVDYAAVTAMLFGSEVPTYAGEVFDRENAALVEGSYGIYHPMYTFQYGEGIAEPGTVMGAVLPDTLFSSAEEIAEEYSVSWLSLSNVEELENGDVRIYVADGQYVEGPLYYTEMLGLYTVGNWSEEVLQGNLILEMEADEYATEEDAEAYRELLEEMCCGEKASYEDLVLLLAKYDSLISNPQSALDIIVFMTSEGVTEIIGVTFFDGEEYSIGNYLACYGLSMSDIAEGEDGKARVSLKGGEVSSEILQISEPSYSETEFWIILPNSKAAVPEGASVVSYEDMISIVEGGPVISSLSEYEEYAAAESEALLMAMSYAKVHTHEGESDAHMSFYFEEDGEEYSYDSTLYGKDVSQLREGEEGRIEMPLSDSAISFDIFYYPGTEEVTPCYYLIPEGSGIEVPEGSEQAASAEFFSYVGIS